LPTREQVRTLLNEGLDYRETARRLGIPPGQAYLIATGRPADGSDTVPSQEAGDELARPAPQSLANPPHENPTTSKSVRDWLAARARADRQMQSAAAARTAEPPPEPGPDEASTDLVQVLARQHNRVRTLQETLEALPSHRTGGDPDDLAARKSVVDLITVHLSQHETAEEQYLWPTVRKYLPEGNEVAGQALEQEQEGKDTLTELGRLDPDTDEFDDLVERLVLQLRKHVAYEERVFLLLVDAVPQDEREKLGKKVLTATKRAPTRPHRNAPKQPGAAVKAAAPGAAAVDKLRDMAGDRPAKRKGRGDAGDNGDGLPSPDGED
jgi:hemerythrin-like domain-containing protein